MAPEGFVFKTFLVRAFLECDISCDTEITCQSYNYVVEEKYCELNNRTKEARPENFRSDPARFYKRRLSDRRIYKNTWTSTRSPVFSSIERFIDVSLKMSSCKCFKTLRAFSTH